MVKSFDPTDIFIRKSRKGLYMNDNLMMDPLLPSIRGHKILTRKVGEEISMLIESKEAVNNI